MAFTNNFRIERIYFEKLKSNIDILKSYIEAGATGEALEILKNSVDVDGAVLLLYRNLGEAWSELADLIQKTQKDLKDLAEKTEAYHDELNERIDEVNNYLMALIRELDARLQAVEQDLATMNRNKFYDLIEDDGAYTIEKDGETVSFNEIEADVDFPHDVILRYDNGTSVTELEVREFTDSRIDFYSIGLADSDKTVKEILVTIDDTEDVTYSEKTLENPLYTFGTGLSLDSNNELSVDFDTVQGKLTEGTGIDIDSNNEISVDTSVVQAKLTEGFGIDIDSNNEIKVDTAQVQEKLIAGQNITLTPDTTDPTKTVIDGQGANYSGGFGIDINTNNEVINTYPAVYPSYDSTGYALSSAQVMPLNANASYTSEQTGRKLYKVTISPSTIQVPTQTKKIVGVTMNINSPATTESASDTTQNDRETQWYGHFDIFATLTFAKTGVSNKTIEEYFGSVVFLGMVNDSDAVRVEGITSNLYNNIEGYANKGFRLSSISLALRGYVTVIGTNDGTGYLTHTRIINFLNTRFTTRPQLLLSND